MRSKTILAVALMVAGSLFGGCAAVSRLPGGKVLEVHTGNFGYGRHCYYTVVLEFPSHVEALQNVCGPPPAWKGMEFTALEYQGHAVEPYITITKVFQKQK